LKAEFDIRALASLEERAAFVSKILGNADDLLHKERPFLWQSSERQTFMESGLEEEKKVSDNPLNCPGVTAHPRPFSKGIFLGRMILKTLAEHIVVTSSVSFGEANVYKVSTQPRGALMLSIQAVSDLKLFHNIINNTERWVLLGPSRASVLAYWRIEGS
jgi:hypothetical protein